MNDNPHSLEQRIVQLPVEYSEDDFREIMNIREKLNTINEQYRVQTQPLKDKLVRILERYTLVSVVVPPKSEFKQ